MNQARATPMFYHPKIQGILNDRALIRALDDVQLGVLQAVLETHLNEAEAGAAPIELAAAPASDATPAAAPAPTGQAELPTLPQGFVGSGPEGRVICYVDGACSGNPVPGGWAAVIEGGPEASGGEDQTTNNRMEMIAALNALRMIPAGMAVEITSDSKLVIETISGAWKPKANGDLWKQLFEAAQGRDVTWSWVKGHNGHPGNERADTPAQMESQSRRKAS